MPYIPISSHNSGFPRTIQQFEENDRFEYDAFRQPLERVGQRSTKKTKAEPNQPPSKAELLPQVQRRAVSWACSP